MDVVGSWAELQKERVRRALVTTRPAQIRGKIRALTLAQPRYSLANVHGTSHRFGPLASVPHERLKLTVTVSTNRSA
jgi:hypothetical protein